MTPRDRALSINLENGVLWREDIDQIEAAIIAHAAELEAQNARLRKVADAAVRYGQARENYQRALASGIVEDQMTCGGELSRAIPILDEAVREYRKELPQNCHKGAPVEERKEWLLAPFVTLTEDGADGE